MRLVTAAGFFDRVVCTDVFAPDVSFKAQLDLFDDVKKDNLAAGRRVISTTAEVTIPPRRTISMLGSIWLVSRSQPDAYGNAIIRKKYAVQRSEGLAHVRSFDQAMTYSGGYETYTAKTYIKDSAPADSSRSTNRYEFYFNNADVILPQQIIQLNGKNYLIRNVASSATEFQLATADELLEPAIETGQYISRTYHPETDSHSEVLKTVPILRIKWELEFNYLTQASEKYANGDVHGLVLKTDLPIVTPASKIKLSDGDWIVQAVTNEGACWGLHLRHA